jgi:hypothetical protein
MTDAEQRQLANELRGILANAATKLGECAKAGMRIEFSLGTDADGNGKLEYRAFAAMKLDN